MMETINIQKSHETLFISFIMRSIESSLVRKYFAMAHQQMNQGARSLISYHISHSLYYINLTINYSKDQTIKISKMQLQFSI